MTAKFRVCLFLALSSHALADGEEETLGKIASESETQTFLKELAERSQKTRTLRVRFRQEKKLRILRRPRRSTGQLFLLAGFTWSPGSGRTRTVTSATCFLRRAGPSC